jgi:hypothetical protein
MDIQVEKQVVHTGDRTYGNKVLSGIPKGKAIRRTGH